MLAQLEQLLSKLDSEEDRVLFQKLMNVVEEAKAVVERGSGSYDLMRAVVNAYSPEPVNLYLWTRG